MYIGSSVVVPTIEKISNILFVIEDWEFDAGKRMTNETFLLKVTTNKYELENLCLGEQEKKKGNRINLINKT